MTRFKFTWHEEEAGFFDLPGPVPATGSELLVLCAFGTLQADQDRVVVAYPLSEAMEKGGIDLSEPLVLILPQSVAEENAVGRLEQCRVHRQTAEPRELLLLVKTGGLQEVGIVEVAFQGPDHAGKAHLDSKGLIDIRYEVSGRGARPPAKFRVTGAPGNPLRITLQVNEEPEPRLLWQEAARVLSRTEGISLTGSVNAAAILNAADAFESLRCPLYDYKENSWGSVLLAFIENLEQTARKGAGDVLNIQLAFFSPRVITAPRGSLRSFFGPPIPAAPRYSRKAIRADRDLSAGLNSPAPSPAEKNPRKRPTKTAKHGKKAKPPERFRAAFEEANRTPEPLSLQWQAELPAAAGPVQAAPAPVSLGASAPKGVRPGDEFIARFVAYEKQLEEHVREILEKQSEREVPVLGIEECCWKKGTAVTVRFSARGLVIPTPEQAFVWNGGKNIISFDAEVPRDAGEEVIVLKFDVAIEGFVVSRLRLEMQISKRAGADGTTSTSAIAAKSAFASYSSKDRPRVLDRVAAVQISAGLDVFVDCLDLHPGEEWKPRLNEEIRRRDLFLLFWSKNASESEWVGWELETAMKEKGEHCLQLHPMDPDAKPPAGLQKFHISDVLMWVRAATQQQGDKAPDN